MTKKERVLAVLAGEEPDCTPVSFSLHFPKEENAGEAGVQSHLKFFWETDTDICKIMNENLVPCVGELNGPEMWGRVCAACREGDFVEKQADFAKRILDGCDKDAFTLGTLHGITASGIHPIEPFYGYDQSRTLLVESLRENPEAVLEAFDCITEQQCRLVRAYAQAGMDGVYYAALGGERRWFTDSEFQAWIEPFDKRILSEIRKAGMAVFLHICKDGLNMERYASYAPYADAVNWGVYEAPLPLEEGERLFPGKTLMGGLPNRSGVMTQGTEAELAQEAQRLVRRYGPKRFILGADCTLPTDISYARIRTIVEAARSAAQR